MARQLVTKYGLITGILFITLQIHSSSVIRFLILHGQINYFIFPYEVRAEALHVGHLA